LSQGVETEQTLSEVTMTAKVEGMVCEMCVRAVTKILTDEEAVETAEVSLEKGEVELTLKPGFSISEARIDELITKAGYTLVSISKTDV
ncbi:MAG: heavy metal-associated domain-containing protein, partial [Pseudomonadota bacterium]